LLALLGSFVLGPLGGITAPCMNFSIGFFVGGQVLAGILGCTVTFGYGPEGKHGANYMQTAAASVAGMAGMGVLLQAMVWMGLPRPPAWQLMLYMGAIGMFGAGVGMLYTPILVDRLQLTFPSGLAVANILRALTDPELLRRSVARLGSGVGLGLLGGLGSAKMALLGAIELSTSTLGAGMLVGARIGIPALVAGLTGTALIPYFVSIGWLSEGAPFRKITFLIGLGLIMGAALLDTGRILLQALARWRSPLPAVPTAPEEAWKRTNTGRLVAWPVGWAAAVVWLGAQILHQPVFRVVHARLPGAGARPDRHVGRPPTGKVGLGDDLQVCRRAAQPDRRQALPAHRHLAGRGPGAGGAGAAAAAICPPGLPALAGRQCQRPGG